MELTAGGRQKSRRFARSGYMPAARNHTGVMIAAKDNGGPRLPAMGIGSSNGKQLTIHFEAARTLIYSPLIRLFYGLVRPFLYLSARCPLIVRRPKMTKKRSCLIRVFDMRGALLLFNWRAQPS